MMWSTQKSHDKARDKYEAKQNWRKWFAWYPVSDGQRNWFWLQFVETRYSPGYTRGSSMWRCREIIDTTERYYVESAGYGFIVERNRRLHQVLFRLESEQRGWWMHEDMVFKAE